MVGFDIAVQQDVLATPTGMAPAAHSGVLVVHPGHQTPLDAADPFARADGYVSYGDDPIANREWRFAFSQDVQTHLNTGATP